MYDANGNLTQDKNKGITGIAYNHLNLPRQIHFGQVGDSIVFRYTAAGQKVAKLVYQTGKPLVRTDYLGAYQYEQDSLKFFPHAEGRVLRFVSGVSGAVSYQREFTVKDHLGNLRLAYRLGQVRTLTAGLEPGDAKRETQQFDSLSVSPPVAQATGLARSGGWAARLNAGGSTPQPLGPLTQLGVQKGDTVTVTAFGYYAQPVQHGFFFTLGSFLAGLFHPAQAPAPGLEASKRKNLPLLQVGVAAGLSSIPQLSGGVPKGYLRVLVFDKDSALVQAQTTQVQVQANQNAQPGYQALRINVLLAQDGYVTAYVGNESDVDVLFDDVSVEHRPGLQVQETEYDPTGLELAGLAPPSPGIRGLNNYRFNGKEFQADLGLSWNHQDWRFFDPQILRWHSGDPEVENGQESWTPYSFSYDNAVRYADANGQLPGLGEIYDLVKNKVKDIKESVAGAIASHYINKGHPEEQEFAKKHIIAGAQAYLVGNEARAKSEAAKLPEPTGDGSTTNALRHSILSAMAGGVIGTAMAKQATDAHEGSSAGVLQIYAKNMQELMSTGQTIMSNDGDMADSFVDQLNNLSGRKIANDYPNSSASQLQNLSLVALRGTNSKLPRLYMFTPVPGTANVRITPTSLTDTVFNKASQSMNAPNPLPLAPLLSPSL